jgi:hypothetical protein
MVLCVLVGYYGTVCSGRLYGTVCSGRLLWYCVFW